MTRTAGGGTGACTAETYMTTEQHLVLLNLPSYLRSNAMQGVICNIHIYVCMWYGVVGVIHSRIIIWRK
jgi:hypothetical protein